MTEPMGLIPFPEDVRSEKLSRVTETEQLNSFGISFLDRALIGMIPSDLVVVGAKSGIGKTEFALHVAAHNARQGKRVGVLALEAEKHEVARRLKYKELAKLYFGDRSRHWHRPISYRLFRFNRLSDMFAPYEEEAEHNVCEMFKNLRIYYRDKGFNIKTFSDLMSNIKDQVDMIVVDHLHYFELNDDNSNREMTQVMKQIRDINLFYNLPIMLVAHLRKNLPNEIPELEDFFGSSDIGKISTTGIMLAPDYEKQDYASGEHGTYIRIVKSRLGNLSRLVSRINYSSTLNNYSDNFQLARVGIGGSVGTNMDRTEYPEWAKHDIGDDDVPF